jgi:hypothetical protein
MRVIIAVLLLSAFGGAASAFHPLLSEDTLFLGRDVRQAELGFEHSVSRNGAEVFSNTASAELSYGLLERVDILLSVPWQGWNSRGVSQSGLGDVSLETKFPVGEKAGWTLALKPGFSMPAGNERKSIGAGKGGVWIYGITGRTAGSWQYYMNAGYLYNRNSVDEEENIFKASAAAAYAVLPKVLVSGDLAAETNTDKNSSAVPVSAVFGLIWSPYTSLDLDAGVRLGLTAPADDLGLLLGLTLRI